MAGGHKRSGPAALLLLLAALAVLRRGALGRLFAALAGALALAGCGGESETPPDPPLEPGCEGRGETFDAGMTKPSADGELLVALEAAEPAPPANSPANAWTLRVTDEQGAPLEHAEVIAAPYMVDHGHGAPNQLASEIEPGVYLLSPLALQMAGLWEVTIRIVPEASPESRVVFSFCIEA